MEAAAPVDVTTSGKGMMGSVVKARLTPAGAGYSEWRQITINSSTLGLSSDQSNFPVLISGTYSYLATTANGGQIFNSNGYDIIFTSDCTGTTQLSHEIESYNAATGQINFWVNVPNLYHSENTTICMFYGNPSITTSQKNKAGVWSNSCVEQQLSSGMAHGRCYHSGGPRGFERGRFQAE